MKLLVTGATGFIGQATVLHLARAGHEITAVVRRSGSASDLPCKTVVWESSRDRIDSLVPVLRNKDAVIHLAGEPVANSRWSTEVKDAIRSSRVIGTRKIVEAVSSLASDERPKTLISASAVGFYGDRGDEILEETSQAGDGFLAAVTQEWEHEALKAENLGLRVVRLRTGIVLGRNGGALQKMLPVVLGDGSQWMSWIHLTDEVRFIEFALANSKVAGAFNLTAPNPARNADFTSELAKVKQVPVLARAPKVLLKAILGEMSTVLLESCRAVPSHAMKHGFTFTYPTLSQALAEIYNSNDNLEERLSVTQFVPRPIEEVFEFFSKAENLEEITPPWLNFSIVNKSTETMTENTLIDYRLNIHGVPARWQSKIERWIPGVEFVDTQVRGPYAKWHHTHRFEKVEGGTLVCDDVIYKIPGGRVGNALLRSFIRRDVRKIFSFRKKKIAEVFKS